jgi:solute carrier family 35 protein E1
LDCLNLSTSLWQASEPVVSAALTAVFLKQYLPIPVYLSLLPVIGGVGLASLKELSFTWLAFGTAMMSNVASASRGILSKGTLISDLLYTRSGMLELLLLC